MNFLRRFSPLTRVRGLVGWAFRREPESCLLLAKGVSVPGTRCCVCGEPIHLPDEHSESFSLASPMVQSGRKSPANGISWLFFGSKVLVATVNSKLAGLLDASVAFFGDRVLVAMARTGSQPRSPILFCKNCGTRVLARVNPAGQAYYGWDWVARLEPRRRRELHILPVRDKFGKAGYYAPNPG